MTGAIPSARRSAFRASNSPCARSETTTGVGAGVGVGEGVEVGVGAGVEVGVGAGVEVGIGVGVEVGIGVGVEVGVGAGVEVGIGAGVEVGVAVSAGPGMAGGETGGSEPGAGVGVDVAGLDAGPAATASAVGLDKRQETAVARTNTAATTTARWTLAGNVGWRTDPDRDHRENATKTLCCLCPRATRRFMESVEHHRGTRTPAMESRITSDTRISTLRHLCSVANRSAVRLT